MPTHRIPVYLWRDPAGNVLALPVDADIIYGDSMFDAIVAPTEDQALKQIRVGLRIYAEAMEKRNEEISWPDMLDYVIRIFPVQIRPRYENDDREYPLEETLEFRLPVLVANEGQGLLRCCIPPLRTWFSCFETDDIKRVVGDQYRDTIYRFSPEEILFDIPPLEGKLRTVSVPVKHKAREVRERKFEALERVARPYLEGLRRGAAAAYCREDAAGKLADLLLHGKRNIALLGPEGAGRSTLLTAAIRLVQRKRGHSVTTAGEVVKHRFWRCSARHLVSGAKYLGQWQERLVDVTNDLSSFDGVLCIDNLADLARLGGDAEESVAAFLSPYLESGILRMVGEITPRELDVLQHRLGGFIDNFHAFPVGAMNVTETCAALQQLGDSSIRGRDARLGFEIVPEVPGLLTRLFKRFCPYESLPGGAATFFRQQIERKFKARENRLTGNDILIAFLRETGLPEKLLRDEERLTFEEVQAVFTARIIGQDAACEQAAQTVINYKAAMNPPNKPIRSMLFCGPTGVGKTQLAKTLAQYLFENKPPSPQASNSRSSVMNRLFRIDMSEYMHPWSATRLIEQDDGTPSPLIRHVRRKPFSVILFDEIEKAAPEVYDLLLGLLDEGRLTDRQGRTTQFQGTIIVMTSNLGSGVSTVGFVGESPSDSGRHESRRFLKAVREFFRPEFFNRIDAIVLFESLDRESCRKIVRGELDRLARREGLFARNIRLVPDETLVDRLVRTGFDPRYGARPLQRMIESTVLPVIARCLLESDFDLSVAAGEGIRFEMLR